MNYLCLTLLANEHESETAFKSRLSASWTHLLRTQPDAYRALFAEAKEFDIISGRLSRQYVIEADAAATVAMALAQRGVESLPLDPDDIYSKYEASSSDWFQLSP
jgi:hypothetical protein